MLRVIFICLCSILCLTGCNGIIYKQLKGDPSHFNNGYSENQLDGGDWLIRYDGDTESKYPVLKKFLVRRASEICPGSFILSELTYKKGFVIHARKTFWPYVEARLKCTEPPVDASQLFESLDDE